MHLGNAIAAGLLAATTLAATVAPPATAPASAAATLRLHAVPADSVVDAYGVGIHTNFLDTPYRDYLAVGEALAELGVRHVRDDLYLDAPRQYAAIEHVAERSGVGFDLILGRPTDAATPADYIRTVAALPDGVVESIEGTNEWDLSGREHWPTELREWQDGLHEAAEAEPATARLPLLSPALAFRWNYQLTSGLTRISDLANAHAYPGGFLPSHEISRILAALTQAITGRPVVTTEAGYHNALNARSSHPAVPEDVSAAYLPRLLLENLARGVSRMYSYELIDSFDDPALVNPEAHFGLLRHDLSPKPAYTAMQRLLALLDDPGPEFDPDSLGLSIRGWPADGRHLLTQRRDGSFVLMLWRDASLWDPVSQSREPVQSAAVTLGLDDEYDVAVHRLSGPDEVAQARGSDGTTTITVGLDAEVTALEIAPVGSLPSVDLDPFDPGLPEPEPTTAPDPAPTSEPTAEPTGEPTAGPAEARPAPPAAVSLRPRRRAVVVRWRVGAAAPDATSYRVRLAGRIVTVGPDRRRLRIADLRPRRKVRAVVRAVSDAGVSPPARSRTVRVR